MTENAQKSKPKEQQKRNNAGQKNSKKQKFNFSFYWVYIIIFFIFATIQVVGWSDSIESTTWLEFKNDMLLAHDVKKIEVINNEDAEIYIKTESLNKDKYKNLKNKKAYLSGQNEGPHYTFEIGPPEQFDKKVTAIIESFPPDKEVAVVYKKRTDVFGNMLGYLLPIAIMIAIWVFIMRRMSGGGMGGSPLFNIGKSKAKLFDKDTQVAVTFGDVAGLEGAKIEIREIVDFLKHPKKYTTLGGKIPKGALLVGPPGTGKTLIAKAVAGEAKVPFFSLSGSDFVEMFVGVGASRVRDLFKQAKEKAPSIIFIDEIDAIGRSRGKNLAQGSNDERENTLNQLLTEMDGFGTNSGVILLAATNRADVLDRALLRPGRFDRIIYVELPDLVEREEIFGVHLKPIKKDNSVDVKFLARQTPGFSGADIANVCNEAALIAARKNKNHVSRQDFLDAVDRIIGGMEKKNKIVTPEEKKIVAYHEAGHATISWLVEHASPLIKVTIVPRGKSLGAAWYLPEERQITTTEQMVDELCAALGGRAAEETIFGKISTGALSDLEKVTKQARAMVAIYGLNDVIGNISYYDSSGDQEYSFSKPYSEKTAQTIDEEISKLIEAQYNRAKQILGENQDKLKLLAEQLLSKEVIFKEDLEEIFGKRKFASNRIDDDYHDTLKPLEEETTSEPEARTANDTENVEVNDSDKKEETPEKVDEAATPEESKTKEV